jgi:flagellar biosynthetic protein FliO
MADISPTIFYMLLSLVVVLALAWIVIRFLAGIYTQRVSGGEIQVKSTYALGTRQQLYVVNFRNTDYLLGVTAEKINVLDTFEATPPKEHS